MNSPSINRQMQLAEPGFDFHLVESPILEPGINHVRVTVEASGVCHSDAVIASGYFPGSTFPLTSGHEVAGRIDAIGAGVTGWSVGDRVAVGWYGGSCGHCDACRTGDGILCAELQVPGVAFDGGYADSMIVPAVALAAIPEELNATEAASFACAGVTVFNALRSSNARPGDTVAIVGIGGLGHLAVQFSKAMGFNTVAIARGQEKEPLALQLGAAHYIDSTSSDIAAELQKLGGATVVLSTVTASDAIGPTVAGLTSRGEVIIVGFTTDPLPVSVQELVGRARTVRGHASGIAVDIQDTMKFAVQAGVRPWTEELPLEQAGEAMGRMASGAARFRMVLLTGN